MNIVFTCGGTGGHIYPAIAVANMFRRRVPDCRILFIGADGMEERIVPEAGFRMEKVEVSGFERKLTPAALAHNVKTFFTLRRSLSKAGKLLREFDADVVLGTGGYASFPALRAATINKIPCAVHESNAVPGLATKLVADHVDRIFVSFESCRASYGQPEKVTVTGTPVREEFLYLDRESARKKLGLDERPLVVSYWGSLGAREMNKIIARFMWHNAADDAFQHIHATGSFGWRWMPEYVKKEGVELNEHPNIRMQEYISDMPTVMAAADLIICRAGAATISEVLVAGVPAIIVPSPNVTNHHQEKNAQALAESGAAVVLPENACSGDLLYETAKGLLADPDRMHRMRKAMAELAVVDSAERIYEAVRELAESR
ncbi:MAG: undecaprenyldiphospho-muramoylpentapeptide beta-N-acetylglucosaminyltransferase [Oscillospiraceae bacterium]|nr:undecaprenyldiphospho-muramoylpentapeptide beta-N-acetylglucosaminyltransferase [Oscillospiraceae bacterium]